MISSQSRSARLSSRLRLSSSSRATASSMQMFKAASFAIQRNINKVVNLLPIPYRLVVTEMITAKAQPMLEVDAARLMV